MTRDQKRGTFRGVRVSSHYVLSRPSRTKQTRGSPPGVRKMCTVHWRCYILCENVTNLTEITELIQSEI